MGEAAVIEIEHAWKKVKEKVKSTLLIGRARSQNVSVYFFLCMLDRCIGAYLFLVSVAYSSSLVVCTS